MSNIQKISGKFQTPVDPLTGNRKEIYPITSSDEVIIVGNGEENNTLTEEIKKYVKTGDVIAICTTQDFNPDDIDTTKGPHFFARVYNKTE